MQRLIMKIMIVLVVAFPAERIGAQYYYGGGNRIPLKIDSSQVTIQFAATLSNNERDSIIVGIGGGRPPACGGYV